MRILLLGVVSLVRVSCWGGCVCECAVKEGNEDSSSRCGVSYGCVLCGCVDVGCVVIDGLSFLLLSLTRGCVSVCVCVLSICLYTRMHMFVYIDIQIYMVISTKAMKALSCRLPRCFCVYLCRCVHGYEVVWVWVM